MIIPESIQNSTERRLIPIPKWNNFHSWPPVGGLRHLIFNARHNGFGHCMVKIGRRILIDEIKFFEWVDTQKNKEASCAK